MVNVSDALYRVVFYLTRSGQSAIRSAIDQPISPLQIRRFRALNFVVIKYASEFPVYYQTGPVRHGGECRGID